MSKQILAEQEVIREFVQECTDLLDSLEPVIVGFGEFTVNGDFSPAKADMPVIHEVFRLFHSIKGSAGFLNFPFLAGTSHAAENLLEEIRTGKKAMSAGHVDLLCKTCDFMRATLEHLTTSYDDRGMAEPARKLTARFNTILKKGKNRKKTAAPAASPQPATEPPAGMVPLDLEVTRQMIAAFVHEGGELLQGVENGLLEWSNSGEKPELLAELFRQMHSFKGNCGFVGLADLERLSHRIETVLEVFKSGAGNPKAKPAVALLNLCDILKETLADIAEGGPGRIDGLNLYLELLDDMIPADWNHNFQPSRPPRLGEILVEMDSVFSDDISLVLETGRETAAITDTTSLAAPLKRRDLRVDLEKIDNLLDLIGELVIAENMLINSPDLEGLELENFSKAAQQMNKIVKELQEVSMTIRMIPVAGLFNRMTRLVHDLSRKSGKRIEFITSGTETEVDKTVIETITDPLVHLIRNSVDHGFESVEERQATGKATTGTLRLSAAHEEGEVLIRIEDDGRGLNRGRILQKAAEKGLINGDDSELDDREVAELIFLPGFSTTDEVTDLSGRGVGMDVVKQNLERINGRIEIESLPGQGTRTTLHIPLTMAIIDGMMVRVGASRFIIPILAIRESFRPGPGAITTTPDGQEMVRVRDRLFPVLRLHRLHKITPASEALEAGILILLENQGKNLCLFVDGIVGQQQTVIKGLSGYLSRIGQARCVSGCTILGNGDVSLILDVGALTEIDPTGIQAKEEGDGTGYGSQGTERECRRTSGGDRQTG